MRVRIIDDFAARMGLGPAVRTLILNPEERRILEQAMRICEKADGLQRRIDGDPEGDNDWHHAENELRHAIDVWA